MKQCALNKGRDVSEAKPTLKRGKWRTDGRAESKSLMVRSGIMTSFCATTLVTPSFVTVFMTGKKIGERKEKSSWPLLDGV